MATPVIMPRQGQSVESCIISRWFKSLGESVKAGDILFAYETDKASFEAEAEVDGILLHRFFEEGDEVPVLQLVAYIGKEGEVLPHFNEPIIPVENNNSREVNKEKIPNPEIQSNNLTGRGMGDSEIKISPRARIRAQALGISFQNIIGSGPYGRIIEQDILNAAKSFPGLTPLAKENNANGNLRIPLSGTALGGRISSFDLNSPVPEAGMDSELIKISNVRKIIARKMHESLQNSAQLTHHTSADARAMLQIRTRVKEESQKGLIGNVTINDMVCYAVIRALKKHPAANSHFLDDSIRKFNKVHLGLAIDTERGLMVPTVRNAEDLSLQALSGQIKALANSCKKGNVDPELLVSESASFTVSNLGAYGVELFTPVINLPQVSILGVNTIIHRPADLGNGVFGFIPVIGLSLTYDHRALDGAPASAFLREIKIEIEHLDYNLCMI